MFAVAVLRGAIALAYAQASHSRKPAHRPSSKQPNFTIQYQIACRPLPAESEARDRRSVHRSWEKQHWQHECPLVSSGMSRHSVTQTMVGTDDEIESQQDLDTSSPEDEAPPVPSKDAPLSGSATPGDEEPSFRPGGLVRTTSTFSFSRASFSSQLSSLTSIALPQAESLAASIAAIPTASKANCNLIKEFLAFR